MLSAMPLPKDPMQAEAYRKRMSEGHKAKGIKPPKRFHQKHSPESIERMRQVQRQIGNDPQERQRRSDRAKANNYGKWMAGRDLSHYDRSKARARKGQTYEEIYGVEQAAEEKQKRVEKNRLAKQGVDCSHLIQHQQRIADARKGRTYEEIYGPERADAEAKKRSDAQRAKSAQSFKKPQREKHNSDYRYVDWRKAVFQRDDFTCQRCKKRGGKLHAHHIQEWSKYPDLRYEVSNGMTLHEECHLALHKELRSR